MNRGWSLLCAALLAFAIGRLWLMQLPSSFSLDEMATVFVARFGSDHPSLAAVAPQAWNSLYYHLPRAAEKLFGFSEIAYRAPSILAMGLALWLIARLAARLIHPEAGWFAAFACFTLRGIDYHAGDAHPYALAIAVACAAVWFLVRWLDSGRWRDAALFVVSGALLWRVHLVAWPLYLVFVLYAVVQTKGRRPVSTGATFAVLGLALAPVLVDALQLYREAAAHVVAPLPSFRDLAGSLKPGLVAACAAGAWIVARWSGGQVARWPRRPASSLSLVLGWWLIHPLCLFGYSLLSGQSVFVPRYLSLALPGAALAGTAAAALFIPARAWKPAAAALATATLLFAGQWTQLWPRHHNSDWRSAARAVNELGDVAVICPSPFIEARPPVWQPDYPLPGFLYAHLSVYPISGAGPRPAFSGGQAGDLPHVILFPFADSPPAERYASELAAGSLRASGHFAIYGWEPQVHYWRDWFARRPEFATWRQRRAGSFADVDVVLFESVPAR